MKLYIDTSNREKIILGVDEKKFETDAKREKSQRLLPYIIEVLSREGLSIENIKEIEVNTGPGSFTGLRVGVAVAQTLGYVLNVTVNRRDIRKGENVDIVYE